jgi:hypothetical protein
MTSNVKEVRDALAQNIDKIILYFAKDIDLKILAE